MADSRRNLAVLDDATLRTIINDPQAQKLLPCLREQESTITSTRKGKNCHKCKKQKNAIINQAYLSARQCIARTRGDSLNKLKTLLNTKQIRLMALNGKGQTVKFTL